MIIQSVSFCRCTGAGNRRVARVAAHIIQSESRFKIVFCGDNPAILHGRDDTRNVTARIEVKWEVKCAGQTG